MKPILKYEYVFYNNLQYMVIDVLDNKVAIKRISDNPYPDNFATIIVNQSEVIVDYVWCAEGIIKNN